MFSRKNRQFRFIAALHSRKYDVNHVNKKKHFDEIHIYSILGYTTNSKAESLFRYQNIRLYLSKYTSLIAAQDTYLHFTLYAF